MTLDSENRELKLRLDDLQRKVDAAQTPRSHAEAAEIARIEARADSVFRRHGERAPVARNGETPLDYRRRVLAVLRKHSPAFAEMDLYRADAAIIDAVEPRILADAQAAGTGKGPLRAVEERDGSGRVITRFHGDMVEWMRPFMSGGQCGRFIRPGFVR